MITGKIIKAISGFYYVHDGQKIWTCHALGVFRNLGIKPLVGDLCEVDIVDEDKAEGSLVKVFPRKNTLIRPAAANIDQALIVFAIRHPDPNFSLLDRFLVNMGKQDIPVVIYFNKADLDGENAGDVYRGIYEKAGYRVITGSTSREETIRLIREELKGKTTVLAGPSGAGKSSLTNRLYGKDSMEVGELSVKLKRGKQTTRHTEIFPVDRDTYVLDTPGFTSLYVDGVPSGELSRYYTEFSEASKECRFIGCSHVNEPSEICMVKREVKCGRIEGLRYDNYCIIYNEIKQNEKNRF